MPYRDLTDAQILATAEALPKRPEVVDFHNYVKKTRDIVNGKDPIKIPSSHKKIFAGENREGSLRLNTRINQLASFFASASVRVTAVSPSTDDADQQGADALERFIRNGEMLMAEGTDLHNWKHEAYRDMGESGICIIQQMPRKGYYVDAVDHPERMMAGSFLDEVLFRRRVDPATFSWDGLNNGDFGAIVLDTSRTMQEVAAFDGAVENLTKYMNEPFDPATQPDASGAVVPLAAFSSTSKTVRIREVWWENGGALVLMAGGSGFKMKTIAQSDVGRVISKWSNPIGHPPFYAAAATPAPWTSPLDEMIQLTPTRNYWATMLDIQASGAIFRNWQLIDTNTQEDITFSHPEASKMPEAVRYDPSQPPPDMGPGTEWKLAPFEFHDVTPRYEQIKIAHESAGSSVARLMGQTINQNTPVGTADTMDDSAQKEFFIQIEALQSMGRRMWTDVIRWMRNHHKEPLQVFDTKRVAASEGGFLTTVTSLDAGQIVTEHIRYRLDTRSRLAKIADYQMYVEMEKNGHMDFNRGVEEGFIPNVDDAAAEKSALFVSELERLKTTQKLEQLAQPASAPPRFLSGAQASDPRGTGNGMGANNVRGSGLAASGADSAAGRA